ncbi:MAG: bifunctional ornithine acetyltransferase/N-acetylglutamate synthase [Ruminococcaceae bacterium]|nr:bifunctional ornithine acetyltransferase/N-acetylglutamate synthase [Oscillospiraceae bacterium]
MMEYKKIKGGVCAAKGFKAAGIHCGIRKNKEKKDLSLIYSEKECSAAAVYTQNKVYGAPITVTREHLKNGRAKAVICNSGNANTCNADGVEKANLMAKFTAKALGIDENDVIVASTGVIGQTLDVTPIEKGMGELTAALSRKGSLDAANGIMTTDTAVKEVAYSFELGGKTVSLGAIAKGSGMIHPNMATMLCFMTTDAAISPKMLQRALSETVNDTFNMISIDGDSSTNDTVAILASGEGENAEIKKADKDFEIFKGALKLVSVEISKGIAKDGEGATKLLECNVKGAKNEANAKLIAKSVIASSLVKCAMFGADANWGRVLCAMGYSGAAFDAEKVDVSLASVKGEIAVCKGSKGVEFSEKLAKQILLKDEIEINITLHDGKAEATSWGCDLTYEYVKINGDYRT